MEKAALQHTNCFSKTGYRFAVQAGKEIKTSFISHFPKKRTFGDYFPVNFSGYKNLINKYDQQKDCSNWLR
jgi:hypothetical protein